MTNPTGPRVRPDTARRLHGIALEAQTSGRVPALFAGVQRGGELLWSAGIGAHGAGRHRDRAATAHDQYLVASNTKTFTAVMVMQARDEGLLDLDDPLGQHLPGASPTPEHEVTVRSALAHVSGMQREPHGDVWKTLAFPEADQLVTEYARAERVGRPHTRWHYSNLMYCLLGEMVAQLDGCSWEESLQRRLLDPLGLRDTTVGFTHPTRLPVQGYFVPPFTDVPVAEPVPDFRGTAPCGGLASTPADMARWSAFVAQPDEAVLHPDTLEEMTQPQTVVDPRGWTVTMGLGFFLVRSGKRILVGHTGGMPGHITGVFTHRESGTGGLAFMNSTSAPDPMALAVELAGALEEAEPAAGAPWTPGSSVPEELEELLGHWYTEGSHVIFSVREGKLEARMAGAGPDVPPAVFEHVEEDLYRTVSGRERGELLRVVRRQDGSVRQLSWATYLVSREPLAFGRRPR
ncbi:CubicO group peptidase, beta-lactamase class C family [Kytococcus aerolatus]|uniref:CubicO group peptidase, beta-lactamase class C family n=1 Tax=Kytococcus aerolatus TaxID=592308 RepID=A0A212TFV9_9MICO|nr:serine hydrolase domain-containing protein [Kytococcus aerolatus]SNC64696.1 CubicO group peptidase, beta-lactamase class C family [Kytococcus aerolatus]